MLQKDDIYLLIILGSLVFILVAFFLLLFVLYFAKRKKQMELEQEIVEKQRDQTILKARLEIQEQTLHNISDELHDNYGQILSLIKINLNTLPYISAIEASEKIKDTKELTQQLISDIKSLSLSFSNSLVSKVGFVKAVAFEATRLNKTKLFSVDFFADEKWPDIENEKSIILYRMLQEILNNTIKHSGAQNIRIALALFENIPYITIEDDGKGFDNINSEQNLGQGISNLYKRAGLINAQIKIESKANYGTKINISLNPFNALK